MIRLRGVKTDQYHAKEEENESFKIMHQIEFNSFREAALASKKMNAKSEPYDDYYYDEMPNNQSVFESNQKSIMVFLVHSSVAL